METKLEEITFSSSEAYNDQFCLEVPFSVITGGEIKCLKEAIMDFDRRVVRIPLSEDPITLEVLLEEMLKKEE